MLSGIDQYLLAVPSFSVLPLAISRIRLNTLTFYQKITNLPANLLRSQAKRRNLVPKFDYPVAELIKNFKMYMIFLPYFFKYVPITYMANLIMSSRIHIFTFLLKASIYAAWKWCSLTWHFILRINNHRNKILKYKLT